MLFFLSCYKMQNLLTSLGPVVPLEQYFFSLAQNLVSVSFTLTSRSTSDALTFSVFPQPRTAHDFGTSSRPARAIDVTFLLNLALGCNFKKTRNKKILVSIYTVYRLTAVCEMKVDYSSN